MRSSCLVITAFIRVRVAGHQRPYSASLFLLGLSISAWAQNAPQEAVTAVEGTITDSTGALIVGAKVSMIQAEARAAYQTVTDSRGSYQIANPATGTYTITVEENGFSPAKRSITVVARAAAKADF